MHVGNVPKYNDKSVCSSQGWLGIRKFLKTDFFYNLVRKIRKERNCNFPSRAASLKIIVRFLH